jgi:hypothetical protein
MTKFRVIFTFCILSMALSNSMSVSAAINRLNISNNTLTVEITPDIGGRLLGISLDNHSNFLYVGDAVITNPAPLVSPESPHVGYMGHEVWVGPQSEWWVHQLLNEKRAAAKSVWPPDPYLVLAKNKVLAASDKQVVLQSPISPVSGVLMEKSYSLVANNPNQLKLGVSAKNIRDTNVSWDIWFNSRVVPRTQVYVPVASVQDIQVHDMVDDIHGPLAFALEEGIFRLDALPAPRDKQGRKGKLMIQPSQGWIAGFRDEQVFIIQFAHQPKALIHPEQGQVELYLEYPMAESSEGLLELEVHAPYKTLQPGAAMEAEETWTLLAYTGANTPTAHIAFLREQAAQLGLGGM